MDTRGYENPFPSTTREIGQEHVLIEEEELNEDLILKSIDEICLNENIEKRMVSNFNKIEIPNSLSIISKFIKENYAS